MSVNNIIKDLEEFVKRMEKRHKNGLMTSIGLKRFINKLKVKYKT